MSIRKRLDEDLKEAMKARDTRRTSCIRMLKSKLLEREVASRATHGKDHELTGDEELEVVSAYAKQRRDSIESYEKGGRKDLMAEEQAELKIVVAYLPSQLSEDELRGLVQEAIEESGATTVKDLGAVMKIVIPKVKGAADGKLVSRLVREALTPSKTD